MAARRKDWGQSKSKLGGDDEQGEGLRPENGDQRVTTTCTDVGLTCDSTYGNCDPASVKELRIPRHRHKYDPTKTISTTLRLRAVSYIPISTRGEDQRLTNEPLRHMRHLKEPRSSRHRTTYRAATIRSDYRRCYSTIATALVNQSPTLSLPSNSTKV